MMRRSGLFVVALFPIALSGCVALVAGAAIGAGALGVTYLNGEGNRSYNAPVSNCWNASIRACRRLNLEKPRGNPPDAFGGQMISRRVADGSQVTIRFTADGRNRTKVGVRFGALGDQALSNRFHDALSAELR